MTANFVEYWFLSTDEAALFTFLNTLPPFHCLNMECCVNVIYDRIPFYDGIHHKDKMFGAFLVSSLPGEVNYLSQKDDFFYLHVCSFSGEVYPKGVLVKFQWIEEQHGLIVQKMIEYILAQALNYDFMTDQVTGMRTVDVPEWRIRRANLFREVKEKHPDYTMEQVANKAIEIAKERIAINIERENPGRRTYKTEDLIDDKFFELYHTHYSEFTKHHVENDYRFMHWRWKKN